MGCYSLDLACLLWSDIPCGTILVTSPWYYEFFLFSLPYLRESTQLHPFKFAYTEKGFLSEQCAQEWSVAELCPMPLPLYLPPYGPSVLLSLLAALPA